MWKNLIHEPGNRIDIRPVIHCTGKDQYSLIFCIRTFIVPVRTKIVMIYTIIEMINIAGHLGCQTPK